MKFIPTAEKVEVKDYPYGYTLRTTLFDSIQWNPKKGYRHVTQTVNPKTDRLNAPKKSTYSPLIVRYYNEQNHIKTLHFDFNGDKEINEGCKFLAENFSLFTPEEINYLYLKILSMSIIDFKATCIYGGSKPDELKPLYINFWDTVKKGIKTGENVFSDLFLDTEKIDATKPANFSPFKVSQPVNIMDL